MSLYEQESRKRKRRVTRGRKNPARGAYSDDSDEDYKVNFTGNCVNIFTNYQGSQVSKAFDESTILKLLTETIGRGEESTPQIWLPESGHHNEIESSPNEVDKCTEGDHLLPLAGLPLLQKQHANLADRQVNAVYSPAGIDIGKGKVVHQQLVSSSGSSHFDSLLKVGSTGTLKPPQGSSSTSQRPLALDATKAVGNGPRLVPVIYNNPQDNTETHFLPVRVNTDQEEDCVKALVAEKSAEFDIKHNRLKLARIFTRI